MRTSNSLKNMIPSDILKSLTSMLESSAHTSTEPPQAYNQDQRLWQIKVGCDILNQLES